MRPKRSQLAVIVGDVSQAFVLTPGPGFEWWWWARFQKRMTD